MSNCSCPDPRSLEHLAHGIRRKGVSRRDILEVHPRRRRA